jgi:hypothetical protein
MAGPFTDAKEHHGRLEHHDRAEGVRFTNPVIGADVGFCPPWGPATEGMPPAMILSFGYVVLRQVLPSRPG